MHHFPVQATAFVGRAEEVRAITGLLADPACRLLTLVGPGGIGKTRLALASAAQAGPYAHGVYFVPLQPLTSSEHLIPALAQASEIQLTSTDDPLRQLLKNLENRECLLLLDNFEHLLDGADLLSHILSAAPNLTLLVTSRERLNLLEEWVFEVGGLAVPPDDANGTADTYSAVQLFMQGAQRVHRDFSLAQEQANVIRICRLVGGMPLALELASAWVRALPVRDIADALERGLDVLETSTRNLLPRHRSMRQVLDYSWQLLTEDERCVFKWLAVFRGGFTVDAAEYVAEATWQWLAGLVDKSWLKVNTDTGRYDLHELLRQYGEERLGDDPGERIEAGERHSDYYACVLRDAWPLMSGDCFKETKAGIEAELENVRAAWKWAFEQCKLDNLGSMIQSLWFFYDSGQRFKEGEQAFARAVAALDPSIPAEQAMRGKLLARQGALCFSLDQFAPARSLLTESIAILEALDAREDLAFALLSYGIIILTESNLILESRECFQHSLALYREVGSQWGIAYVLHWLGSSLHWLGSSTMITDLVDGVPADLDAAKANILESLAIFRQLNNLWGIALTTQNLSIVAYTQGQYAEGRQMGYDSLALFEEIGVQWGRAMSLVMMAASAGMSGDYAEARRLGLNALEITMTYDFYRYTLQVLYIVASVYRHQGYDDAAYDLMGALHHYEQVGGLSSFAVRLFPELELPLVPARLQAAIERNRGRDFETMVQDVMADLRRENGDPAPARLPASAMPLLDPLTEREMDVLRLLMRGLSNREIAGELVLALGTVKTHVHNICGKLGANSRAQALVRAREMNLI